MTTSKPKKYKVVDRNLIYQLASIYCGKQEIAEAVGCSVDTLNRRFSDLIEQGRAAGRKSLRRVQWEKALKGDTKMLMWLGKNILKQKDQVEDSEEHQPLPWTDGDKTNA